MFGLTQGSPGLIGIEAVQDFPAFMLRLQQLVFRPSSAHFKWEFASPHHGHQNESHRFLRGQAHLATDFLSLPQEPLIHPRAKQNIHGSIVLI